MVDISGQRVDISGQTIIVSGGIDISGQRVDISGERVDISGQRVDISGQRVDISGSRVDISGQRIDISGSRVDISGQRVDISGQSIIVTSMPPITVTADISGQRVDINGETINSRCYASTNGTTWHHLSSDANGRLNIHSRTQDGDGTDITSTLVSAKQGLDVNVIGSSVVPIGGFDGSVTVALRAEGTSNNLRVAPYINNSAVGATTTTVVGQASKYGMNSFITNTVNEPVAIGAMDASGNFRNIRTDNSANLLVNVANTVPISGSVSLAGSSAVQITNGTINAGITSTISNVASSNGLVANAVNYALTNTGTVSPVTSLINGAKNQLETRDNDAVAELTTIDNKIVQGYNTTNDGGVIGLNINQIRPKNRFYTLRGRSIVSDVQMIMGSVGNTRYFYSDAFGIANVKPWWCYSEIVARTVTYEYVDASGNEGTRSQFCPANVFTALPLANGSAGNFLINNWTQSINPNSATGTLYFCHSVASGNYSSAGGAYTDKFNSLFTVPNGYVACVTNVVFYSNAAEDYLILIKWNASGIREIVFYWTDPRVAGGQVRINQNYYNEFGGAGGVFTAGETIAFSAQNSASYKDVTASIMLMPV